MTDSVIVNPQGKPARATADDRCPQCGAESRYRVPSGGFGQPHPVCNRCGYEWMDQVFVFSEAK